MNGVGLSGTAFRTVMIDGSTETPTRRALWRVARHSATARRRETTGATLAVIGNRNNLSGH
jgi:hypothetical protein